MDKHTKLLSLLFLFLALGELASAAMEVDLFVHKDKYGKSLSLDIGEKQCTNVPRLWANLTMSVDTRGQCIQFYDKKSCKGRIAVIQPFHAVHQMDLSLINFHNSIQSLSPCGPKVPSGRYVIQSAVDASILTVMKHSNEFARVNTLPAQAFIPKAQQWEISEKQPNEYDIVPRIHETNFPITYDGEGMKTGTFIRKVWKIESVGRGRYVIKSEWTQKCLYKTRIRTVEEHDCRAWSPNQEWVLRPLIAPKVEVPPDPQLADGVNFQVPSKVVDKYLKEQKRLREKENKRRTNPEHSAAYLQPYRINSRPKSRKDKVDESEEDNEDEERQSQNSKKPHQPYPSYYQQSSPPNPEIIYSQLSPVFGLGSKPHPLSSGGNKPLGYPQKIVTYMNGLMPIYEDSKKEDPVFPDFLLHASSRDDDDRDPGALPKYSVTRRPSLIPEPTGHPDYIPRKKKYDGRIKDFKAAIKEQDEGESEEADAEDPGQEIQDEPSEEEVEDETDEATQKNPSSQVKESEEEEEDNEEEAASEGHEEQSTEQDENENEAEEQIIPEASNKQEGGAAEEFDEGEDPARDVASFMKLLFQGISNKMKVGDKVKEDVEEILK